MKHTFMRKHPRRKCQTKKYKKFRSNKGRRMVGGYSPVFTRYISLQIEALTIREFKIVSDEEKNPIFHIVRNIASGGSFTNKINGDGFFTPGINLANLLHNARVFYNWTKGLNASKLKKFSPDDQDEIRREQVTLYRHVRISPANAIRNMIQPIPISCTWDINFAIGWMQSNGCCICELMIPSTDVFLPLSMPPPEPAGERSPIPLNQPQYEVTVAPCILTYINTRMHPNGTTIYTYNARTCANLAEVDTNFNTVERNGCFF
jgi:hypothetical protein